MEAVSTAAAGARRLPALLRAGTLSVRVPPLGARVALLGAWLVGVVLTATRHEFWRDEVRALSLASVAGSPVELFQVIRDEGHPVLWYLLLYAGRAVVDTPAVLPVVSILVAFAAVAVLVLRAPFPLWIKALFAFGGLAFYEYSVMARNYGISMLLLFVFAALYRHRRAHPLSLGVVLALLANTNAHSVILALLLAAVWSWDVVAERRTLSVRALGRPLYLPLLVVGAGVALCAAVVMPRPETVVTDAHSLAADDVLRALAGAALLPAEGFRSVVPEVLGPAGHLVLVLAALGLLARPPLFLAALAAPLGLGTLFAVVYPGGYRHEGLLVVFLLSLYWIALETWDRASAPRSRRVLFRAGLYLSLGVMLGKGVLDAARMVARDFRLELSSGEALGAFLAEGDFRDAVLLPEPDYLAESVPYYADNPVYIPRERRFGRVASFTTRAEAELSLAELLDDARGLAARTDRPVLIVLGHRALARDSTYRRRIAYGRYFTWTPAELARLREETELVSRFTSSVQDENYLVYAVRR